MQRVLLIIDDSEEICALMERVLRNDFEAIHIAGGSTEAISFLESEPVTHVVCDLYLGEDEPLGHELISGWREKKPTIRYVALFTGSSLDLSSTDDEIDELFRKPRGVMDLIRTLKTKAA